MSSDSKKLFKYAGLELILFCIFTIAVKYVDVQQIGPDNSIVGFGSVNGFFKNLLPFNSFFFNISELCGYFALTVVAFFGIVGFVQLFKRKKLLEVDFIILMTGVLYFLVVVLYVVFDKVIVINMRPYLMDGVLEPSYPSSHTLLAFTVLLSASYYFLTKNNRKASGLCRIFALLTVILRFLSGAHWFTDIVAGVILAEVLLFVFKALVALKEE